MKKFFKIIRFYIVWIGYFFRTIFKRIGFRLGRKQLREETIHGVSFVVKREREFLLFSEYKAYNYPFFAEELRQTLKN